MTPIHRLGEEQRTNPDLKTLEDYAKVILTICGKHGIDVIDLFKISPLDSSDEELMLDRPYSNDKGHDILAQVIAE